jgi:hypothetical protein
MRPLDLLALLCVAAAPARARGGIDIVVVGEIRVDVLSAAARPTPWVHARVDTGQAVVGALSAPLTNAGQAAALSRWGLRQLVAPPGASPAALATTSRLLEREGLALLSEDEGRPHVARYRGREVCFLVYEKDAGAARAGSAVADARRECDFVLVFMRGGDVALLRAAASGADAVIGVRAGVGAAAGTGRTVVARGLGAFLGAGDGAVLRLSLGEAEPTAELTPLEAGVKGPGPASRIAAERVRAALGVSDERNGRIRLNL